MSQSLEVNIEVEKNLEDRWIDFAFYVCEDAECISFYYEEDKVTTFIFDEVEDLYTAIAEKTGSYASSQNYNSASEFDDTCQDRILKFNPCDIYATW